jgi:S-adenosylmethionine hydrolase
MTDFGHADGYQGVLEGVIAGINPAARVITISHEIPPGDILGGWYLLKTHHHYFPPGTIHLAIVDPGVGTGRKILAVSTGRYGFVGPDNGLLSFIPGKEIVSIHAVTDRRYAISPISPVFHGRDIMAPAAAYLSLGIDPSCLGRASRKMTALKGIRSRRRGNKIYGRAIWVDHFGNLISNIDGEKLPVDATVEVNNNDIGPVRRTFSDVGRGRPLAYIGSGDHLEIAVREGSALEFFGGDRSRIEIKVAPV